MAGAAASYSTLFQPALLHHGRSNSYGRRDPTFFPRRDLPVAARRTTWGAFHQSSKRKAHFDLFDDNETTGRNSSSSSDMDMSELSRRIQSIQTAERLLETLQPPRAPKFVSLSAPNAETMPPPSPRILSLPVIAFDALLPGQRLSGTTSDPTFCRFLQELSIGGLFVMTSVNHAKRMIRRNGVLAKIELVDAVGTSKKAAAAANIQNSNNKNSTTTTTITEDAWTPTAVDFQIAGLQHCRILGPAQGMKARIGRWRRVHDPDGEESVLGWGEERFVDCIETTTTTNDKDARYCTDPILLSNPNTCNDHAHTERTVWTENLVDCNIVDPDRFGNATTLAKAASLLPLLQEWQAWASNASTYDNIKVVAMRRIVSGQPGLYVDPAALLRRVLTDIGDPPQILIDNNNNKTTTTESMGDATALAFWGAALINPLPALGVSPEIRGRVLEADTAYQRLQILEWGIRTSLANLKGEKPLRI